MAPADLKLTCPDLPFLSVIPSDRDLVGAELELVPVLGREYRLQRHLESIRGGFDYIVIDCPPSLGLLTVNALVASDRVLVPVQCEYLALEGISQLIDTINRVKAVLNPGLEVAGVVMTMYDDRTNLAKQVVDEVRSVFGEKVYRTMIPRNIRLGEAPSYGKPIFLYDIRSRGADAYFELAKEFLEHEEKGTRAGIEQLDSTGASPACRPADSSETGRVHRLEADRHRQDRTEP